MFDQRLATIPARQLAATNCPVTVCALENVTVVLSAVGQHPNLAAGCAPPTITPQFTGASLLAATTTFGLSAKSPIEISSEPEMR